MSDLQTLFIKQEEVKRWRAERENASARYELAQRDVNAAHLISQHEPLHSLELDRDKIRALLGYLVHGDLGRLGREVTRER